MFGAKRRKIEIELWESGHEFEDPWPKNIVRLVN
jgi:hypothetical protein